MKKEMQKIAPHKIVNKKKSLGQGMTEYIIIVALIAIAAIAVFRLFGDTARNQVAGMAMELGGQNGANAQKAAKTAAKAAETKAATARNLNNYTGNN
ncbi:pilus assembly protein [Marinibactrum halimedae]|uniref:Membrane protein n=1 Tax=Marinibactrum halimedae TaxID=1444977 RepID=A0AA37T3P1_9GAMM|nr:pilus assembly protein [Marinibactrum halimedae]MCD9460286.1 pilus assembly protein [Marinibactrum halimedae]GLS24373.1 membrane protein [Marinibactrum halimedae]